MKNAIKILLIISVLAGLLLSCSKDPVIIGDPKSNDYKPMSVAAIRKDMMNTLDQPVAIEGEYQSLLPAEFVADMESALIMTDFGEVIIVLPKEKYTESFWKLKKGDPVHVYGAVTSVLPPGKTKALLAIEVQ